MRFLLVAILLAPQLISNGEIEKLLADRIDRKRTVGIVAGVLEPAGRRVVAHGVVAKGSDQGVNGDTVFEIGSVTKIFTGMLLADMVEKKEVALSDPISKYLPASVKAPPITLEQLATHTSGLPRLPSNFAPKDRRNPFADYTVAQLYEFLSAVELAKERQPAYSNVGVGLLGHILALRAGMDYETLVRKRILEPLGMKDTSIALTPAMKARLATGHDEHLDPVMNWDLPVLAGAGALRSTVNDMLIFVAAMMDREPNLAWQKRGRVIWHNGWTGGYRSWVGFDPKRRTAVVVLSNSANPVEQLGEELMSRESTP
jgi:CubicO group peptidase (beta-lactamase class C family)